MAKPYLVRKIEWGKTNDKGVAKDCIDMMNYFNAAIKNGSYPLVPRTNPITEEEILKKWIPNIKNTITYIAVDNDSQKVICSGTLFLNLKTNIGELSITKDIDYSVRGVGTDVTKAVINEALSRKISISVHTSIDNKGMCRIMEKLGYTPDKIIHDYERYRGEIADGADTDVFEWNIRPS